MKDMNINIKVAQSSPGKMKAWPYTKTHHNQTLKSQRQGSKGRGKGIKRMKIC